MNFESIIQEIQQDTDRFMGDEQKENLIKVFSYISHLKSDDRQYFILNLAKIKEITGLDVMVNKHLKCLLIFSFIYVEQSGEYWNQCTNIIIIIKTLCTTITSN